MNSSKFILRDNQGDIEETVSKILQKNVKNEDLEKCIRLVSEKKNTTAITKDVALKTLAAVLSSLHWEDESNKDEENENEKTLDDTQSTIIFDDSQQNNSQSSSQKLTQNPKQSLSQDKARQIPSQENHVGSQNDGKKWTQKRTTICRYYKKGFCRSGKNCNFEHPKMCEVFKRNGLAKFNERGCDGKCKKLHPLACRESLRKGDCTKDNCNFFHTLSTKQQMKGRKEELKIKNKKQMETQPNPTEKAQNSFLESPNNLYQEILCMRQEMKWMMSMMRPNLNQDIHSNQNMGVFTQRMFPNSQ